MSDKELIPTQKGCCGHIGRIKAVIFFPVQGKAKQLDPITEDAEFEIVQPSEIEWRDDPMEDKI